MDIEQDEADDERAVELSSISAIFPEIEIDPQSPFKASLSLPIAPSTPVQVVFKQRHIVGNLPTPPASVDSSNEYNTRNPEDGKALTGNPETPEIYSISHFPPLQLSIVLPEQYPTTKPPQITLSTQPQWIPASTASGLVLKAENLWDESGKDMVIYTYIDYLQQSAETLFDINSDQNEPLIFAPDLKIPLLDFDIQSKEDMFRRETFVCGICLEPKKGEVCHRMQLCSHVFCVPCLQDFYNTCIDEGDVHGVKCINPGCGKDSHPTIPETEVDLSKRRRRQKKKDQTLSTGELLQIPLKLEVVQRYARLKRKMRLESDKTVIYCPRQWCQGAARSKRHPKPTDPIEDSVELSEDEEETQPFDPLGEEDQLPPMSKRLSICEDCGYAFCSVCKKGWHGELVYCYPRRKLELSEEEKATDEYLKSFTSPCPTCEFRCQKSMGCNHMICSRCKTHFCYLCSSWLFPGNPYEHYNKLGSACHMRLWDLESGDGIGNPIPIPDPIRNGEENPDDIAWQVAALGVDDENRNQPPPPAPDPPRAAAPPRAIPVANHERGARDPQNGVGQQQPPDPGQVRGLQRFLYLVQHDLEDEWDSDELDDDVHL